MVWYREGFSWNLINGTRSDNDLKFRLSQKAVNDVGGMTLHSYSDLISNEYIVAVGNSNFASRYTETFVNFTVNFQINDCRMIPIIIPNETWLDSCNNLVGRLVTIRKSSNKSLLNELQRDLLDKVSELYQV